jgi:ABC-type antimicrobial peptide transport system permease subunit
LSGAYGIPPPDAALLAGAVFAAVGFVASLVPVRRALRLHAMDALRYE